MCDWQISQKGEEEEERTSGKERSSVRTSESLDAQELALFGHSLGLENTKPQQFSESLQSNSKTGFYERQLFLEEFSQE